MVLTSSYPKGRKIRLCTGGAVTILQCGTPIPIDEGDLKNGTDDSTLGSLVFSRSKDGGAGDRPLPEHSTNQTLIFSIR